MTEHPAVEQVCEKTELPVAWCHHCKSDNVRRRHVVLKHEKRGLQPQHLT